MSALGKLDVNTATSGWSVVRSSMRRPSCGRTLKELEQQVMGKQAAEVVASVHDLKKATVARNVETEEKVAPLRQSSAAAETVRPARNASRWAAARQPLTTKTLAVRYAKGPDGTRGFAVGRGRPLNAVKSNVPIKYAGKVPLVAVLKAHQSTESPTGVEPPWFSRFADPLGEEDDDFDYLAIAAEDNVFAGFQTPIEPEHAAQ